MGSKKSIKKLFYMATATQETLYGTTVYFNPRGYSSRKRLYNEFVTYTNCEKNFVLITVEIAFGDRAFEVTDSNNPHHVQLRSWHELWHKEKGLEIGMQRIVTLYPNAEKICWLDSDIRFGNPNWVNDTLKNAM